MVVFDCLLVILTIMKGEKEGARKNSEQREP